MGLSSFGSDVSTIKLIIMKFSKDICDPQRMNPNDFGDSLTFCLAPSSFDFVLNTVSQYLNLTLSIVLLLSSPHTSDKRWS